LVNMLVNLRIMLNDKNPYSCIQVENIIGISSTADQVLRLHCKIDPKKLLMLLGLKFAEVENPAGNVRIKFFLDSPATGTVTVKEPLKEFYTKIASETPFPEHSNPSMPFMMGRVLPALTVGTLAGIVELICGGFSVCSKDTVGGLLDDLINPDAPNRPFLRNRIFALRSLIVLLDGRIAPAIKNIHSLPPPSDVQHFCMMVEPVMDIALMRGGIGEPSLSVMLFKTFALYQETQSKLYGEPTYQYLKQKSYDELQVVDNIMYDIHANILQFDLLRSDLEKMSEGVLVVFEVEKHFMITKPVLISKILNK